MDEGVMLAWVERILAPFIATAPDHVTPILILDSYICRMMVLVVRKISELGAEVKHIPVGCISL